MKKQGLMIVLVLAVAVVSGCSKGYETQKSAGGLQITLQADRYPLVKGDNSLKVKAMDNGKAVTDATVDVRFYMPPMPGMAPMETHLQPQVRGGEYPFTVNVSMEGGWKLDVTVNQPGKAPATATFNVDAR